MTSSNMKYPLTPIMGKLREIDHLCKRGKTIMQAVACVGISENTYYRWREKYGWRTEDEFQRMGELERENAQLKELVRSWATTLGAPRVLFDSENELGDLQ